MNLVFENSFVVMPTHCNYMFPMIFGGAFFSEVDLCAACCVNRLLHDSDCDSAVTYKVLDLTFHCPAYAGDIIFLKAEIVALRNKSITVRVTGEREKRSTAGQDHILDATFVFVSKKGDNYAYHGLTL